MGRSVRRGALAAAVALLCAPASAYAWTGIGVGASVGGSLAAGTTATVGSFSCTSSSWSGAITANAGAGNGGSGSVTAETYGGCTSGGVAGTVTALGVPRTWSLNGAGTGTEPNVQYRTRAGFTDCRYAGYLNRTYDQSTGAYTRSGTLAKVSGPGTCPATVVVYDVRYLLDSFGQPLIL